MNLVFHRPFSAAESIALLRKHMVPLGGFFTNYQTNLAPFLFLVLLSCTGCKGHAQGVKRRDFDLCSLTNS